VGLPIGYLTVAIYYKLNQSIASSLRQAGIIHGKENREKDGGGGMHGKSFLFHPAAPEKAGIDEAG
jgi:hypothetical protein